MSPSRVVSLLALCALCACPAPAPPPPPKPPPPRPVPGYQGQTVDEWVQRIRDGSAAVDERVMAAHALGKIGAHEGKVVAALAATLADPDPLVRDGAAGGLLLLGADAEPAVDALARALSDTNLEVGAKAAQTLKAIGPAAREAVPALEAARRSLDERLSSPADAALRSVLGDDYRPFENDVQAVTLAKAPRLPAGVRKTKSGYVSEASGVPLVYVPAATFRMGSTRQPEESPLRAVQVSGFFIGATEVTYGQFRAFCKATARVLPPQSASPSVTPSPRQPVVGVDWWDAAAFCAWAGGRLPTEAEWELAARGPSAQPLPRGLREIRFHVAGAKGGKPHPVEVGSFPEDVSVHGARDMAGNVSEWTFDAYAPYRPDDLEDPATLSGAQRTWRGGNWEERDPHLARRGRGSPLTARKSLGFRLCVPLSAKPKRFVIPDPPPDRADRAPSTPAQASKGGARTKRSAGSTRRFQGDLAAKRETVMWWGRSIAIVNFHRVTLAKGTWSLRVAPGFARGALAKGAAVALTLREKGGPMLPLPGSGEGEARYRFTKETKGWVIAGLTAAQFQRLSDEAKAKGARPNLTYTVVVERVPD